MRGAILTAVLVLAGCTDTATMFPSNDLAQHRGAPILEFRRGLPQGPVKVTMPDGEVLTGSFQLAIGGGTMTAFGPGGSATAFGTSAGGNFFAAATGPRTTITCHGNVSFGHGGGVCRTTDGAEYQVQI